MGSLLEELARRETAARKRIEEIREQIERLQENLTAEEQALSRLVVTRETVQEILGEAASERPPADVDAGIAGSGGGLERVFGGRWRVVPPRVVDQPSRGDNGSCVQD